MELSLYPIFRKNVVVMFSFVTDVVFNYSETYLEMKQSLIH